MRLSTTKTVDERRLPRRLPRCVARRDSITRRREHACAMQPRPLVTHVTAFGSAPTFVQQQPEAQTGGDREERDLGAAMQPEPGRQDNDRREVRPAETCALLHQPHAAPTPRRLVADAPSPYAR